MRTVSLISLALLATSACTAPAARPGVAPAEKPPAASEPTAVPTGESPQARGLAFVQAHCAACHAVTAGQTSPRAEAPAFESVVNTPGLTTATLQDWLRNSHNYPDAMNFWIEDDRIGDVTAYMLTLRTSSYHPPII